MKGLLGVMGKKDEGADIIIIHPISMYKIAKIKGGELGRAGDVVFICSRLFRHLLSVCLYMYHMYVCAHGVQKRESDLPSPWGWSALAEHLPEHEHKPDPDRRLGRGGEDLQAYEGGETEATLRVQGKINYPGSTWFAKNS